jgi:hypothetical protein
MKTREAGVVFSSVDQNPLKYISGLSNVLTPPILIISLISMVVILLEKIQDFKSIKTGPENLTHLLLIGNFFTYLIFFSLNKRLVERWMLPIIPVLCIYATYGIQEIGNLVKNQKIQKIFKISLIGIFLISYFCNALILFKQIKLGDTRLKAYEWTKDHLRQPENTNLKILVYTNKGRDPFSRIDNCDVKMFEVYESKEAEKFFPVDPKEYNMVITYSGMERNYNNPYVAKKYPEYNDDWISFQKELDNSEYFKLMKSFETTKINLVGLSDIFVYEKLE